MLAKPLLINDPSFINRAEIIWEKGTEGESFDSFPVLEARVRDFITRKVTELKKLSPSELVAHRYSKFRKIGTFKSLPTAEEREQAVAEAKSRSAPIIEDWIKKASAKAPNAKAILDEFHEELKKVAAGK